MIRKVKTNLKNLAPGWAVAYVMAIFLSIVQTLEVFGRIDCLPVMIMFPIMMGMCTIGLVHGNRLSLREDGELNIFGSIFAVLLDAGLWLVVLSV